MCGEKFVVLVQAAVIVGSPPRVRGKAPTLPKWATVVGITPACAGKRQEVKKWGAVNRDHPRVCGEKNSPKNTAAGRAGSPPRVRGKDFFGFDCLFTHGITPACAGKSTDQY